MPMWKVEYTDEFDDWYQSADRGGSGRRDRQSGAAGIDRPGLGRPVVDNVHQSRHPNMKELRAERAIRTLFAFDPRRTAILLIGGDKSPDDPGSPRWNQWYDRYTPIADGLYDTHLEELTEEGLI